MSARDHRPSDRRLSGAWLAACAVLLCGPGLANAASVQVTINANGTFSPQALTIRPGDTVRWTFSDRTDSVISAESANFPAICSKVKPYVTGSFAGPMPEAVSGIFSLGPFDEGLVEVSAQAGCVLDDEGPRATSADGATVLCRETPFTARELPGDQSQEGKIALVRRLVRGGLLKPVVDNDSGD